MRTTLALLAAAAFLIPRLARAANGKALSDLNGQAGPAAAPAAPAAPASADASVPMYASADGTTVLKDEDREPKAGDEVLAELRGGERVRMLKQIPHWCYVEVNRRDYDEKAGWSYVRGWVALDALQAGFPQGATIPQQHAMAASPNNPTDPRDLVMPGVEPSACRDAFIKSLLTFVPPKANPEIPYVWGGTSHRGVDCSGLVVAALLESNCVAAAPPRRAQDQQRAAIPMAAGSLQPGDLVFVGNPAHHVFVYAGNDPAGTPQVFEAPETGKNVSLHPWRPGSRAGETYGSLLPVLGAH